MVSQSKLIKQGIYLTDSLFDEIIRRLNKGIRTSDTLEDFLNKTKDYTMNNPLVVTGYKDDLLEIILKETNNHKFSRPSQKELTRATIENRVGDLIVDVGEDIKMNVRDIVKHGYNNSLSQDEIAENITKKVNGIKNKRARAIARTEIARTATSSDYVISKERGANAFTVDCRNTACDVCKKKVLKNPERVATGKGMTGDVEFSIDDVENLPPFHPNCRCVAMFFIKEEVENHNHNIKGFGIKNKIKEKLNFETKEYAHLKTPEEVAEHYKLTYDDSSVSHHIFIDEKNDCTIKIDKNLTDGKKPVIDMTNSSKGEMDLGRIIKSYVETPESLKLATNKIEFLNEESPDNGDLEDALARHELDGNNSNIYVYSKSAIFGRVEDGNSIERQLLHEMSHAKDLNPIHGLHLSDPKNNKCKRKRQWGAKCSDYAFSQTGDLRREEAIAEAMSMVVYKNRQDKSTARIKVPIFDENGKYYRYEVIGYEEWHERFYDLAIWLEKELDL